MSIPRFAGEVIIEEFGKMVLTERRVIGPASQASNLTEGSILIEDVVFCGITTEYPSRVWLLAGGLMILLGFLIGASGQRSGLSDNSSAVAACLLIGVMLLLAWFANKKSLLRVNSANGSLLEAVKDEPAAEHFLNTIQWRKLAMHGGSPPASAAQSGA